MSKWMLKQTSINIDNLSRELGLNPIICTILAVRGYNTVEDIRNFLGDEKLSLPSPLLFKDMEKAIEIILKYISLNKKIAIFGDYDADGITSTVILYKTLSSIEGNLTYYIPSRENEGYGLSNSAIDELKSQGVELIIACDNGISAHEEIEYANCLGLKTVVIDHHDVVKKQNQAGEEIDWLPHASAIVNPKQSDCPYPFKGFCAAAICYRFSQALYEKLGKNWEELNGQLLPFATIATICDLMELTQENRIIVKRGMKKLANSKNPGLISLLKETGVGLEDKNIVVYHIGYILGPCINASGRLEMATLAVDLFLTEDINKATEIARHLVELNNSRKEITSLGLTCAQEVLAQEGYDEDKVIVLFCPEIPESVAGIIAGKIKERYYRPTVVISGKNGVVRGSCRSIEGYNITQALSQCNDILEAFGGHPMAAGLSMKKENIPLFRQRLNEACQLTAEDMVPVFRIDAQLQPEDAFLALANEIQLLGPFGKGHGIPYFASKKLNLQKINLLGKDKQVMKLFFSARGRNNTQEFISFNGKNQLEELISKRFGDTTWQALLSGTPKHKNSVLPRIMLDLIYSININFFNNREYLQLQVVDFRISQD